MMPFFQWFRVDRQAVIGPEEMRVVHVCRIDAGTFKVDHPLVDQDGDTTVSADEIADCCVMAARYLAMDLIAVCDSRSLGGTLDRFQMLEGDKGFRTEIVFVLPSSGGRSKVTLLDPAYLMPRVPVAEDPTTSAPAATASGEGVSLIGEDGQTRASVPLVSHFSVEFTMERPLGPEEASSQPASLLEQFERAEAAEAGKSPQRSGSGSADSPSSSSVQISAGNGSDR